MCDEQMDVAYCLRKAEDYRQKAKVVSEPRLKLLRGNTWRKRASLTLHFHQMARIDPAWQSFIAGIDQKTE